MSRYLLAAWRAISLALLITISAELYFGIQELKAICQKIPEQVDLSEIDEGVKKTNKNLDDLWSLINQMVK